MKRTIIIVVICLFTSIFLQAQDVIVKKNGDEIKAKIEEVSTTDIKYRKHDNLEGPLFYIPKTDVFMIRYEDGTKETFIEKPAPQQEKKTTKTNYIQPQVVKSGGPRVGITFVGPGKNQDILINDWEASPFMSQFGWAFESRLFTTKQGASGTLTALTTIGAVEHGLFFPSITGFVGIRTAGNMDFSIGPSLSVAGTGLAMMAGTTVNFQGIQVPLHVIAVPTQNGFIFNLMAGFNIPRN